MPATPRYSREYLCYLNSEEWAVLRERILERAGGKCEICGFRRELEVHHRNYDRFGHEELSDLLGLCRECHEEADAVRRHRADVALWGRRVEASGRKRWPRGWRRVSWSEKERNLVGYLRFKGEGAQVPEWVMM